MRVRLPRDVRPAGEGRAAAGSTGKRAQRLVGGDQQVVERRVSWAEASEKKKGAAFAAPFIVPWNRLRDSLEHVTDAERDALRVRAGRAVDAGSKPKSQFAASLLSTLVYRLIDERAAREVVLPRDRCSMSQSGWTVAVLSPPSFDCCTGR